MTIGDNIIIEIPPAEESERNKNFIAYLQALRAEKIAEIPRHIYNEKKSFVFLLKSDKSRSLKKSTWLKPSSHDTDKNYIIISDLSEKFLKKTDTGTKPYQEIIVPWHPGINLVTFKMYNGAFPLANDLKKELHKWKDEPHNDWQPNNFIIQGNRLKMVDYTSTFFANTSTRPSSYYRYNKMLQLLETTDPKMVEKLFWQVIKTTRTEMITNI